MPGVQVRTSVCMAARIGNVHVECEQGFFLEEVNTDYEEETCYVLDETCYVLAAHGHTAAHRQGTHAPSL